MPLETRFWSSARVMVQPFWYNLVDLGRHFGGHWISSGQSTWCFSGFFGAVTKTEKQKHYCSTTVPLKLESANNEKHIQNEDSIHLAFLSV